MKVLLVMDPFIKVPPAQYGGIERVVADLADGLAKLGHDITLWAAPGSRVNGRVDAFGKEGEWTRWSNLRNTMTLAGRFLAKGSRFDVIHNFGRLAYLAPMLSVDVPKVQTYMRTVNPQNMVTARRLGARRLHYTAVSAAIRDTGRPGGGDWSVIYNCAAPERYPFVAATDPATAPLVFLGRLDRCMTRAHNRCAPRHPMRLGKGAACGSLAARRRRAAASPPRARSRHRPRRGRVPHPPAAARPSRPSAFRDASSPSGCPGWRGRGAAPRLARGEKQCFRVLGVVAVGHADELPPETRDMVVEGGIGPGSRSRPASPAPRGAAPGCRAARRSPRPRSTSRLAPRAAPPAPP